MDSFDSRLLRIGIFYDGNYFYHVSNYYCYAHQRRARLSIPGLHDFVKRQVAELEGVDYRFCHIVDCHYFRGRLPAMEANARQILLNERVFDDILMREGVVTHYLPMSRQGGEKGVDVWLSLESLELTIFKKFNIVVLLACDGDYVPLVRKLNSIGTRVMVLGWDFEYMDDNGNTRSTTTSARLMNEVTYPVWMHKIIDDEKRSSSPLINALFVPSQHERQAFSAAAPYASPSPVASAPQGPRELQQPLPQPPPRGAYEEPEEEVNGNLIAPPGQRLAGKIVQLKNGYGFITTETPGKNLFFFWEDIEGVDFNELRVGDSLEYELGVNERGECAKHIRLVD